MKTCRILILLFSLLFSMTVNPIFADDNNPTSSGYDEDTLKSSPRPPGNNKPRTPSMQQIFCTMTESCVTLSFTIPEGECNIFIQDDNTGYVITETFDSEELLFSFNTEGIRSCHITLTSELGNTYVGSLSIEK